MGATVITLVFIMVISPVIDMILIFADKPHWFLLSTNGDSIATVYGGYELFLEGFPMGGANMPDRWFQSPDISLMVVSMVIYLVAGFVLSVWISRRRQLA